MFKIMRHYPAALRYFRGVGRSSPVRMDKVLGSTTSDTVKVSQPGVRGDQEEIVKSEDSEESKVAPPLADLKRKGRLKARSELEAQAVDSKPSPLINGAKKVDDISSRKVKSGSRAASKRSSDLHLLEERAEDSSSVSEIDDEENNQEKGIQDLVGMEDYSNRDVMVVRDVVQARRVMDKLRQIVGADENTIFACDTEVMDIDVTKESPRGHGTLICFSVYCGSTINFDDTSDIPKTHLWVDTLYEGDKLNKEIFLVFREFFEDEKYKKVWHNYGFDRHVITRTGCLCQPDTSQDFTCRGFAGDTMHMARLWDSSRKGKGYTLASLSTAKELTDLQPDSKKTSMKDLFAVPKLKKDGTFGKVMILPPIEKIQSHPDTLPKWIHYSVRDAKATFDLYQSLKKELMDERKSICEMDPTLSPSFSAIRTLWDFYQMVWVQFGDLLTEMEDVGFFVDNEHLRKAQLRAETDRAEAQERFQSWVRKNVKGAEYLNINSATQIRTLLFAGVKNRKTGVPVEASRPIKVPNPEYDRFIEEELPGRKPSKLKEVHVFGIWAGAEDPPLKPLVYTSAGWPAVSAAALRSLTGKPGAAQAMLKELYNEDAKDAISDLPSDIDDEGSASDLERAYSMNYVAAENGLGPLYYAFGEDRRKGLEATIAVEALIEINTIEKLLSSFILPLQENQIKGPTDRVHCSMNINTETGRLSCRRPNLQNQPSLEKDRYKVRQSFKAEAGNTLIVADYGQLELRILAHLTNCRSMIQAFEAGGDFHSRTAASMYSYIQKDIDDGYPFATFVRSRKLVVGKVALEKGMSEQEIPLVKDVYSSERRKAKILNFSIAYGKTVHGLSKDWRVSLSEAQDTLERWYSDRREVKDWQDKTRTLTRKRGYVTTLMGRRRYLPEIKSRSAALRSHAERAAINTPTQGGAADIVTAAMIRMKNSADLKQLGFRLLSQVHDEVILEGPIDTADQAKRVVVDCMERPFPRPDQMGYINPLHVDLAVDCSHAETWYDAK